MGLILEGGDNTQFVEESGIDGEGKRSFLPPPTTQGEIEANTDDADALESKMEKMLNKIPPDWDLAERHGLATLAYDPSKCTDPYDMNSDQFCHCCQHQVPGEDDFYPLDDNLILGELGDGFPILFQLMKYLNWMLFFMIIFFFIPAIALIAAAVNHFGTENTNAEEKIALYSFGAFLKYMEPDNLVEFKPREGYIIGYCIGLAVGILVTFIFIQIIRKKLNNDADIVDKLSFTPSDFGVIVHAPEFSEDCDYSQ